MRTSAGFFDTGLSGKMRIQIRPPRLIWRVIARRAASIWRAVRRPRTTALRPYSPKLTLLPTVATPLLRPFCSLRYFLLAGCSIFHSCASFLGRRLRRGFIGCGLVGDDRFRRCRRRRQRLLVFGQNFAFEHPHLDPDDAVGGLRFGETVVDVRAQCMQRHAAFAIPLSYTHLTLPTSDLV